MTLEETNKALKANDALMAVAEKELYEAEEKERESRQALSETIQKEALRDPVVYILKEIVGTSAVIKNFEEFCVGYDDFLECERIKWPEIYSQFKDYIEASKKGIELAYTIIATKQNAIKEKYRDVFLKEPQEQVKIIKNKLEKLKSKKIELYQTLKYGCEDAWVPGEEIEKIQQWIKEYPVAYCIPQDIYIDENKLTFVFEVQYTASTDHCVEVQTENILLGVVDQIPLNPEYFQEECDYDPGKEEILDRQEVWSEDEEENIEELYVSSVCKITLYRKRR